MQIYVIKSGDTIYKIANAFGVPPEWIISVNELEDPEALAIGQALVIPAYAQTYTVTAGDSLSAIAARFQTSLRALYQKNPQLNGNPELEVGESLVISYRDPPQKVLRTNGYAYPFISEEVLRKTLPYLTYLTVFSYGFQEDGTLIVPNDAMLLQLAKEYEVAPILLLSTLTEEGTFNNQLSAKLFEDPSAQDVLIENLISVMREKGYRGIDIDFEYVFAEDSDAYAAFVKKLQERMAQAGFFTVVSLVPKTSPTQEGLLYQGHSYPDLGEATDYATIMAYEWGYTYGPPMAIAPLNKVAAVLDYAVTEIPTKKLWLGTPNYAYDFTLPYQAGTSMATSLSNRNAVRGAFEKNAEIQYDPVSQAPFYTYYDKQKQQHEVWFEDARSVNATSDLIDAYAITALSVWNIMRYFPQLWQVLALRYQIETV